jgi:anti-anti-sigma factor
MHDTPRNGSSKAITHAGEAAILDVEGEIDLGTADDLSAQLHEALATCESLLVVDLTKVDFLGSAGLSALIDIRAQARRRGVEVCLVCGQNTRRTIELMGLGERFIVVGTKAAALRSLSQAT